MTSPAATSTAAAALDHPLPVELTGRFDSWWTRYRRHPLFSRRWAAGRAKVWGLTLGGLLMTVAAAMALSEEPVERLWVVLVKLGFLLLMPVLAGPWIGFAIRRRALVPRIEMAALVAALAALAIVAMATSRYLAAPITDAVLSLVGQPITSPTQTMARVSIGILVGPEGRASTRAAGSTGCAQGEQRNADGRCEQEPEPPIGQSPAQWATTGSVIFLLSGGMAVFGIRRESDALMALAREQALAKAESDRREAELRLSVLAAQVEPHFLFNTLAGVRSAIHGDPARASAMVDSLVDYLRASIPKLRDGRAAHATLGQQLDVVRAYLDLMAARMPRLSVAIDRDPALAAEAFPPLMLISLVENAIKHGVEPKIGPARIEVAARLTEDGCLAVTVHDDGVGFGAAHTAGSGIGLANIRERLQQMYGDRASLELTARRGGGVAATVTVPIAPPASSLPGPASPNAAAAA